MNLLFRFIFVVLVIAAGCDQPALQAPPQPVVVDSMTIDRVWSGHPVGFDIITDPPHQYVTYYDSNRVMTVVQRNLGEQQWQKVQLDEQVGWDSHNSIDIHLDDEGYLHLSGNMHVDSLVYFQATQSHDIQSLERRTALIGKEEDRVTYPDFFNTPDGDLIFTYRDGGSGQGNQIYNRYDPGEQKWTRLLDEPLVDGRGAMNAYIHGPVMGPDGYFHWVWVWRDTPDAATNHDLSYAKSKDLKNWVKSDGSEQTLPITIDNCEIIDPVPAGGGMINGNTKLGFDQQNRPVVTYHKFGPEGNTQVYNARREEDGWQTYQATDWDFRWEFGGGGSIPFRVRVYPIEKKQDHLTQQYLIDTAGVQRYRLNPENLKAVEKLPVPRNYPSRFDSVRSEFPEMIVNTRVDQINQEAVYLLRWETLDRNRDRPREGPIPDPTPLKIYRIELR